MDQEARHHARDWAERAARVPTARPIGRGEGWSLSEFTCRLGPQDRPFEEQHDGATIATVVEGTFQYRTAAGTALLYPGAFLLGNPGTCFECGHDHSTGDRCIAFHFELSLFEEIAAAVAGSSRFRFSTAMLPAIQELALPVLEVVLSARDASRVAMDELAIQLGEIAVRAASGSPRTTDAPSSRDQRRISNVLQYIEEHAEQPLSAEDLAGVALMSKYHFLRTFRRIVGVTAHQFLLDMRIRRAAIELRTTAMPISTIAFDAGFGDLSAFNRRFREVFGMTPGRFRRSRKDYVAGVPEI